jgi:hypothetical protein
VLWDYAKGRAYSRRGGAENRMNDLTRGMYGSHMSMAMASIPSHCAEVRRCRYRSRPSCLRSWPTYSTQPASKRARDELAVTLGQGLLITRMGQYSATSRTLVASCLPLKTTSIALLGLITHPISGGVPRRAV